MALVGFAAGAIIEAALPLKALASIVDRRGFVRGGIGALAAIGMAAMPGVQSRSSAAPLFFSACSDHRGQHYIAGLTARNTLDFLLPVPERAHDSCHIAALGHVAFFGRSPSQRVYIVDLNSKTLIQHISAQSNRHFFGHGVVDGAGHLYLSENNRQTHGGVIGVYDSRQHYRRIAEFPSYGIEPHQLQWLADQTTLVVANGGLIKAPGESKTILNQDRFQSSIAYIDAASGRLLETFASPHQGLSLRHLAVDRAGQVFIGAQSYRQETLPLIYRQSAQATLSPLLAEDYIWQSHQGYTASLALSDTLLAVSSPRGNLISFWDVHTRQWIKQQSIIDVAGIAALPPHLVASSGAGCLTAIKAPGQQRLDRCHSLLWDNHLSSSY